jgi:peptidoglycan hydrolase-like protein with peptidoglycan-binding domain
MKNRKAGHFSICFGLLFMLCGCDVLYRLLDKQGAQEKQLIGEVVPFEKNLVVEEIQSLLYLYGYNTGKVDGVLGLRTRNAVEKFQKDNGLDPSRFVDQVTWEKLNMFKDNELVIKGQLNIRLIQVLLKKAGFDPGAIDGKLGSRTKAAVLKFQESQGLKADGKIGYQTLSKLAILIPAELQVE